MAAIDNPRQLFLHELGDILYVEKSLTEKILPKLIDEIEDRELRRDLQNHLKETRKHAKNVERVFDTLGERPQAERCLGFEGLKSEHDELSGDSSDELVDLVDAGAAARTEHYEIAAYGGLIAMARSLGEREAVDLLEKNLREEKDALKKVEKAARRLSRERSKELAGVSA